MRFFNFYQSFLKESFEPEKSHPIKPTIRVKRNETSFTAYIKGRVAGRLIVDQYKTPKEVFKVATNPQYRRMGVATALYNAAITVYPDLTPSSVRSDDAVAFWSKFRPGSMKKDLRSYKQYLLGKHVKTNRYSGVIYDVGGGAVSFLIDGKKEGETDSVSTAYPSDIKHLLPPDVAELFESLESRIKADIRRMPK